MNAKDKFIISVVIFAIGAYLIFTNMFSALSLEWTIGVIMVAIAGPTSYYLYTKYKSGYQRQSDEEIIIQTKASIKNKGK